MFRVIHNGMKIKNCNSMYDVNTYINNVLSEHSGLNPALVYKYKLGNAIFMCYRYYTYYCEMFLIEIEEN